MTVDEVMDIVKKDVPYYRHGGGGVTVSGGEAALYPAFIKDLFRKCRRLGISTAIETCGCVPWKNYERFLDETDIVLYDLKHMNRKLHKEYTGKSNELILENAKRIACHRVNMVVRIPLVPTLTATEENLRNTGEFVIRHLPGVRKAHILPFHQLGKAKYVNLKKKYSLIELKAPSFSEIDRAKEILEACGLVVEIGG